MSLITDTISTYLPSKRKKTPSGWLSFNAVCCSDDRGRGGFIINGESLSYHCFNCGFKASWQPGWTINPNMIKFMKWLHIPDDAISKLRLEAFRLDENNNAEIRSIIPKFLPRDLPMDSLSMIQWADTTEDVPAQFLNCVEYLINRNINPSDFPFYWTPKTGFSNRVIIPFYKDNVVVGWTARAINDAKPKYISEQQPGYVFNLDRQHNNREFVIVCEGPFDAISIDGCALLGAEIKDSQNWLLKQLNKEIILVPDKDHEGPRTIERAIEYGWSVSMPDWPEGVKDVNDAVVKLGKLATLYLIVNAKESNALKIQLKTKKWFKEAYEKTN